MYQTLVLFCKYLLMWKLILDKDASTCREKSEHFVSPSIIS